MQPGQGGVSNCVQHYQKCKSSIMELGKIWTKFVQFACVICTNLEKFIRLILKNEKDGPWIYKVKNDGLASVTASLGLIFLWDIDGEN